MIGLTAINFLQTKPKAAVAVKTRLLEQTEFLEILKNWRDKNAVDKASALTHLQRRLGILDDGRISNKYESVSHIMHSLPVAIVEQKDGSALNDGRVELVIGHTKSGKLEGKDGIDPNFKRGDFKVFKHVQALLTAHDKDGEALRSLIRTRAKGIPAKGLDAVYSNKLGDLLVIAGKRKFYGKFKDKGEVEFKELTVKPERSSGSYTDFDDYKVDGKTILRFGYDNKDGSLKYHETKLYGKAAIGYSLKIDKAALRNSA